jgi:hypothetical protein
MPLTIESTIDDEDDFEISEDAAQALPFGVASLILRNDLNRLDEADILYAQYQQKIGNIVPKPAGVAYGVKNTLFKRSGGSRRTPNFTN